MRNDGSCSSPQHDCAAPLPPKPTSHCRSSMSFSDCFYGASLPLHGMHVARGTQTLPPKGLIWAKKGRGEPASVQATQRSSGEPKCPAAQAAAFSSLSHLTLRHKPTKVFEPPAPVAVSKSYRLQAPHYLCGSVPSCYVK